MHVYVTEINREADVKRIIKLQVNDNDDDDDNNDNIHFMLPKSIGRLMSSEP